MGDSTDLVTVVIILLVIVNSSDGRCNSSVSLSDHSDQGVSLLSTLKQKSLCPGDGGATFTCTTVGTDLTWLVGNRLMSYNTFAMVGAIRSNAEFNDMAVLLQVVSLGENGLARRVSVLHVSARTDATEPLTVQCHNGTMHCAEEETFLCRASVPPPSPILSSSTTFENAHATVAWEVSDVDRHQQIDHFIVQLDNDLPLLVKNYSTTVVIRESGSDHTITVKAVNECEQKGDALMIPMNMLSSSTTSSEGLDITPDTPETPETTTEFLMYQDTPNSAKDSRRQGSLSVNMLFLLMTASVPLLAFYP